MKILFCFGTRPEWLKIKPIIDLLNKSQYDLFFTNQHNDLINDVNFDYNIDICNNNNRLNGIIESCLNYHILDKYDYVIVQGDTASAFACALSAFNNKIKLVHLEAGLRTYDLQNPYPEEAYRQMISRISYINLCPTKLAFDNLNNEKVQGKNFIVGNTILDTLVKYKNKSSYGNHVLITLHRRENHDIMKHWFENINSVAEKLHDLEFILPIHPNPYVIKHRNILSDKIKVTNPFTHDEFIDKLINCKFVITDSGGIQEEATFLQKKTIVCRKNTERPEGIDSGHLHICPDPNDLNYLATTINKDFLINAECPYGNGDSSEKIIKILLNDYSNT